ncbi:histidine phosphatase family protein [Bacillus sp. FJAT-42376]|uniref:histidine phosphatase family protein n=1 Tax=Bacillus sp. FJAT-42376 TaxID=2014076 RepID=UPI000F4F99A1|nr:histidine phosphatase family protein [Bacillus sp. FJAT-42376]AZB42704.1 histidine phosphatase family protein [Bacillus sp. FJAT-42376]
MPPSRIVLFRHAEKYTESHITDLSPEGWLRSRLLCRKLLMLYPDIEGIYAAGIGTIEKSRRKIQTVLPLITHMLIANKGEGAINTVRTASETKGTAKEILKRSLYVNKTVIVCWAHSELPSLARELNGNPVPGNWPDNRYDVIWEINGKNGVLKQIPQLLLPGDSPFGID